ncbi:hypothetical protein BOX15_Mlig019679g1, partial [Macrostomum lignano]
CLLVIYNLISELWRVVINFILFKCQSTGQSIISCELEFTCGSSYVWPVAEMLKILPESELEFRGPFNKPITSLLRLCNQDTYILTFKVKTTVPKCYSVRPNIGLLQPFSELEVAITLLPLSEPDEDSEIDNVHLNQSPQHKFMIQTMVVKPGALNHQSVDALWKAATPRDVMCYRLNVSRIPVGGPASPSWPLKNSTAATRWIEQLQSATIQQDSESNASNASDSPRDQRSPEEQLEEQLEAELHRLRQENARLCQEELRLRKVGLRREARRRRHLRQLAEAASSTSATLAAVAAAPVSVVVAFYRFFRPPTTDSGAMLLCLAGVAAGVILGKLYLQQ